MPVILLLVVGISVTVASGGASTTSVVLPIAAITSLVVGAVLISRLPRHRIGWLLWASGLLIAATVIFQGTADLGLNRYPGSVAGAIWFAWVGTWVGGPALFLPAVLLPLLYPTGKALSPRWDLVGHAFVVVLGLWCLSSALLPFPVGVYPPSVRNPLAVGGGAADLLAAVPGALDMLIGVLLALAVSSLAVRYRRAQGLERAQLRWVAYVGGISFAALLVAGGAKGQSTGPFATLDAIAWLVAIGALALLPIAVGVAVLRYRLYEIDRLISRTLSYALLSVLLGGMFVGVVVLLEMLLSPLTRSSELAVAGSTFVVAALFQPVRLWVQGRMDRRFNRARYDAQRALAAFSARLRDQVDPAVIESELRRVVAGALEPMSIVVWLR